MTSSPTPTLIPVSPVVDVRGGVITASVAVKIDNFSLMVVAYTFPNDSSSLGIVGY